MAKLLTFDVNYILENDGRCYSLKTNKYLKPLLLKNKRTTKIYYRYDLGRNRHLINRLVMFMFGNHNFKKIEDMPMVLNIDGDLSNNNISNLRFTTQSEVNKIYNIRVTSTSKSKILLSYKDDIENRLKDKQTYKQIAKDYNVSEMVVYRFIKKNINKSELF